MNLDDIPEEGQPWDAFQWAEFKRKVKRVNELKGTNASPEQALAAIRKSRAAKGNQGAAWSRPNDTMTEEERAQIYRDAKAATQAGRFKMPDAEEMTRAYRDATFADPWERSTANDINEELRRKQQATIEEMLRAAGESMRGDEFYRFFTGSEFRRSELPPDDETRRFFRGQSPPRSAPAPAPAQPMQVTLDADMLRRLIYLCHPDKHGNSEPSKLATTFLLGIKDKR